MPNEGPKAKREDTLSLSVHHTLLHLGPALSPPSARIPIFFKFSVHDQARARQEIGPSYPQSLTLQVIGRNVFARHVLVRHPQAHHHVS